VPDAEGGTTVSPSRQVIRKLERTQRRRGYAGVVHLCYWKDREQEAVAMIDIGMIVIQVKGGSAIVTRCEFDGDQVQLVPAANAGQLAERAARVVAAQDGTLDEDGCSLCSDELQEAAVFPPLVLPNDAIPYHEARALRYPDVSANDGWRLLHDDQRVDRLRVYRTGVGIATRRFISRATIEGLMRR